MATFDPVEQRLTVRVVYDGVACAGKTTNLRQLCALFAAQRSSKVYSPADTNGRTLYFDWMQIMAGLVCGFPLLCQIVSVPGQVVLTPRRRHLLASADVIVYVCESGRRALTAARTGLEVYDELVQARGGAVPLVIQANKQDQVGALDGASLAKELGRPGTPVVEGVASEGVGVVDTFVTAVRTVARALQARSEADALRVHVRRAETAAEVLAQVSEARTDPEWAAEMVLEEAAAALMLEEATRAIESDEVTRAAAAAAARDLCRPHDGPAATAPVQAVPTAASAPEPAPARPRPRPPSWDVPTGFIWPAHTGRATLQAIDLSGAASTPFDIDGVLLHVAHAHVARTSVLDRFPTEEAARLALVRRARECSQLDRLLVPGTVLVAQTADDGCWLWTVSPAVPTIARDLREHTLTSEQLAGYAAAAVEVLRASLQHGFRAQLSPDAFGLEQGVLRYTGDLLSVASTEESVTASLSAALNDLAAMRAPLRVFVEAFEAAMQRRMTPDEKSRAGIAGVLSMAAAL